MLLIWIRLLSVSHVWDWFPLEGREDVLPLLPLSGSLTGTFWSQDASRTRPGPVQDPSRAVGCGPANRHVSPVLSTGALGELDGGEENALDTPSLSGEEGGVSDPEDSAEGDASSRPSSTPLYEGERGGRGRGSGLCWRIT